MSGALIIIKECRRCRNIARRPQRTKQEMNKKHKVIEKSHPIDIAGAFKFKAQIDYSTFISKINETNSTKVDSL